MVFTTEFDNTPRDSIVSNQRANETFPMSYLIKVININIWEGIPIEKSSFLFCNQSLVNTSCSWCLVYIVMLTSEVDLFAWLSQIPKAR